MNGQSDCSTWFACSSFAKPANVPPGSNSTSTGSSIGNGVAAQCSTYANTAPAHSAIKTRIVRLARTREPKPRLQRRVDRIGDSTGSYAHIVEVAHTRDRMRDCDGMRHEALHST